MFLKQDHFFLKKYMVLLTIAILFPICKVLRTNCLYISKLGRVSFSFLLVDVNMMSGEKYQMV